jgi:hypothetical protein
MKTLKFQSHLVPFILSGEKTSTRRLFDDKNLSTGDEVAFINKDTGEEFARATLIGIREKKLEELQKPDFEGGRERHASKEAMLEHYKRLYNREVGLEDTVKIISFRLVK